MADFPTVNASEDSQEDVQTTLHTVQLPTGIVENELLMVFIGTDFVGLQSWAAGWYRFADVFTSGPNSRLNILIRYADGTEGSTIQFTTPVARTSEHVSYRIGCYQRHAAPQIAWATQNAGANFSSPLLDPAGWGTEDITWISVIVTEATISAFPSGYTGNQHTVFPADFDSQMAICTKELTASSEDPPFFTHGSSNAVAATIALRPIQEKPSPSLVGFGTFGNAHTFNTNDYDLPRGLMPDDIIFIFAETGQGSFPAPSGWAHVPNSPQSRSEANSTQLNILWKRAVDSDTVPGLLGPTLTAINHVNMFTAAFRSCPISGNPWDVTSGGNEGDDTTVAIPGATTTVDGCLVIAASSSGVDIQTPEFSGWANADLLTAEEILDRMAGAGHGGGFGVAIGEKTNAGTYGATTAVLVNSSPKGLISIALKPDLTLVSPECDIMVFNRFSAGHD